MSEKNKAEMCWNMQKDQKLHQKLVLLMFMFYIFIFLLDHLYMCVFNEGSHKKVKYVQLKVSYRSL